MDTISFYIIRILELISHSQLQVISQFYNSIAIRLITLIYHIYQMEIILPILDLTWQLNDTYDSHSCPQSINLFT